jgi:COP9 signalosome complex subunit 12
MDPVFHDFREALRANDGYALAATLTPIPPSSDPMRLSSFYFASNASSIQRDLRDAIIYNQGVKLSKAEGNAWLEIFASYWNAIGELLNAEDGAKSGKERESSWTRVYEAWKEVVNLLIRGHQNLLEAWTLPCLYVGGNYLRKFAIKADEQAERQKGSVTFNAGFQDDIVGAFGKHEKLEDAGRQINKIFSLCIGDR